MCSQGLQAIPADSGTSLQLVPIDDDPNGERRQRGEAGLAESVARLRDRLADPTKGDPLISLGEVLGWCYSLEEYHRKRLGWPAYNVLRASPDGETEAGLIYARGLFAHSLDASAGIVHHPPRMIQRGGVRTPYGPRDPRQRARVTMITGAVNAYVFKPLDDLPEPAQPERYRRDEFYRQRVADREIVGPLESAIDFLMGIA